MALAPTVLPSHDAATGHNTPVRTGHTGERKEGWNERRFPSMAHRGKHPSTALEPETLTPRTLQHVYQQIVVAAQERVQGGHVLGAPRPGDIFGQDIPDAGTRQPSPVAVAKEGSRGAFGTPS